MAEETNKRAKIATVEAQADRLVFTFADEDTVELIPAEYPENIRTRAMWHGLEQKGRDSYAGVKDTEDPVATAKAYLRQVDENLRAGLWNTKREAGEGAEPPIERLVTAMHRAMEKAAKAAGAELVSIEQVRAKVESLDKKGRAQIRRVREVADELNAMNPKAPKLADLMGTFGAAEQPAAS